MLIQQKNLVYKKNLVYRELKEGYFARLIEKSKLRQLVASWSRSENKDERLTILSRESPREGQEGPEMVPPKAVADGTSVGCWMLGARRLAGWYYSEPFVTRASRQPLSLLSLPPFSSPTAPRLRGVFIAANRRNMPTRSLRHPSSSPVETLEDRLRECKDFFRSTLPR